jgi:hypothetical protein
MEETLMNLDKILNRILNEQSGQGKGKAGTGGTDFCACPNKKCKMYGKKIGHPRSIPCNTMKCKICGTKLTGVGTVGTKL